jgi:hypothetical protein
MSVSGGANAEHWPNLELTLGSRLPSGFITLEMPNSGDRGRTASLLLGLREGFSPDRNNVHDLVPQPEDVPPRKTLRRELDIHALRRGSFTTYEFGGGYVLARKRVDLILPRSKGLGLTGAGYDAGGAQRLDAGRVQIENLGCIAGMKIDREGKVWMVRFQEDIGTTWLGECS